MCTRIFWAAAMCCAESYKIPHSILAAVRCCICWCASLLLLLFSLTFFLYTFIYFFVDICFMLTSLSRCQVGGPVDSIQAVNVSMRWTLTELSVFGVVSVDSKQEPFDASICTDKMIVSVVCAVRKRCSGSAGSTQTNTHTHIHTRHNGHAKSWFWWIAFWHTGKFCIGK